jgi:hypothetical protein
MTLSFLHGIASLVGVTFGDYIYEWVKTKWPSGYKIIWSLISDWRWVFELLLGLAFGRCRAKKEKTKLEIFDEIDIDRLRIYNNDFSIIAKLGLLNAAGPGKTGQSR